MSLYVGHLSPHVQPDELERVFRRFGRCSFQLKDGYGFVVYEVSANAERALRALRGKQICGEQISLNWSNKQPRPFQRPTRDSRFDEPYRRRVFRDDNSTRFRNSQDRKDFSTDVPLPDYNHEGRRVDGATDKEAGLTHEDADSVRGNKGDNLIDALMDDEDAGQPKSLEHDRWGEPTIEMLPGHGVGKGSEFDRYEPYRGYNRRGEKEGHRRGSSDSSPYRCLHGKGHKENFLVESDRRFDKSIPHLTCYNCGKAGHIKRKCPEGDGRRDRYKFEQMMDEMCFRDKVEGRLKKFRANSWVRPSTSRDPFISRRRTFDRLELFSNNGGKSERTKTSPEQREKNRSKPSSKSQNKKGTKKKYSSKRREGKKRRARVSDTSSTSSDSSKSSSGQSESRSISDTRSHSTSVSPSSRSAPSSSSTSRSISISSYAKSKTSRSRSRSMSRPRARPTPHRSLSLSISLGSKSSSSPKNIHNSIINAPMKDDSEHMEISGSKSLSKMNHSGVKPLENENSSSPFIVENQPDAKCSGKTSHESDFEVGYNETDACFHVFSGAASENLPETSTVGVVSTKPVKHATDSTRISTGEMLSALRHYGLVSAKKDEHELDVTVESYLGAARLWPWEMIYYRRLKKGPISTENYAKRLEQNKEFGIADKYIRGSSGWGERQRDA
ncbi:hypothetical protein KSP39_PZI011480 [Platanthera zijinensis]|uniref:Serine/arginine-rich splicing factor 4 n=1 Tax=Platanthera zijinensis TaxID=2320716 RepID=A0AAP0BI05_9ASPA